MKAMVLEQQGEPLRLNEWETPLAGNGQLQIKVKACGVCRTDLHVFDGDLTKPKLPLILGHEIVGEVASLGEDVVGFEVGDRVGVPWLGSTCGSCQFCLSGDENLCDDPAFTGYNINGGYAEYTTADASFCFPLPSGLNDAEAAPLLCAGVIGYRSLRMAGEAEHLGIYGFGAAAHIVAQIAVYKGWNVYAFTRPGDISAQNFARELGAKWAGSSQEAPPHPLDAAIIFAPVGPLIPAALKAVKKGGTVVCGGIHMSDIPTFEYEILWGERSIKSVANLTREDAREFLDLAPKVPVITHIETFPLDEANEVLDRLREGHLTGAAVLIP